MTSAELASFATLIMASATVIILILVGAPWLARILFCHRLETVRDDCADLVLAGRLPRDAAVQSFMNSVDETVRQARGLTLPRALAMYLAMAKLQVSDTAPAAAASYSGLKPGERGLMDELERRRKSALWSYLTWGSPMGWVIAPLLIAANRGVNHEGRLAKAQDALPSLTREAALCSKEGPRSATAQWVYKPRAAQR